VATPVLAAFSQNNSGGSAADNIDITEPGTTVANDLLVIIVGNDSANGGGAWNTLSGWTRIFDAGDATSDTRIGVYWRKADGAETSAIINADVFSGNSSPATKSFPSSAIILAL